MRITDVSLFAFWGLLCELLWGRRRSGAGLSLKTAMKRRCGKNSEVSAGLAPV